MKIRDLCTHKVVLVEPTASLREASLAMRNAHVGCVVVAERRGGDVFPLGIVTDRDIVIAVLAPGARAEAIRAQDLMSQDLAVVGEDDGVYEASCAMAKAGVRRLPVVRANGSLAGIVAADDLLRVIGAELINLSGAATRAGELESLERLPYGGVTTS